METPTWQQALAVMRDISAEYGPSNAELSGDDRYILLECWRLSEMALTRGELDPGDLRELAGQKVVADNRSVLMAPALLYFEDLPGLADELPAIRDHVIRRPDGAWRAMHAAGVQDLSQVAAANIVDVGDRLAGDELHDRIAEREEELARVIAPGSSVSSWRDLSEKMRALRWVAVSSLTIAWELEAFGRRFPGDPRSADALWHRDDESLYVAIPDDTPLWEAVARELVRALLPDVEPAALALGIAAALGSHDREAARRALNAAGYAQPAPELRAEIVALTATDLDTDDTTEPELSVPGAVGDTDMSAGSDVEHEQPEGFSGADGTSSDVPADTPTKERHRNQGEYEGGDDETDEEGSRQYGGSGDGEAIGDRRAAAAWSGSPQDRPRSRLRSYVVADRGDASDAGPDDNGDERTAVDMAGIAAVVFFERENGREPEVKPHHNRGYDIASTGSSGEGTRYIEVKATAGPWDDLGAGVTAAQFQHAQEVGEQFWLYVVEYAQSPSRRRIWSIQDPARRVGQFMFDDGWKGLAEHGWKGLAEPEHGAAAPNVAKLSDVAVRD